MVGASMRKRSFAKDRTPAGKDLLLGYARVSKGDEQTTPRRPKRCEPLAAGASSRKRPPVAVGIGPNCTACSTICAQAIQSWSGSSIVCRAR